MFELLLSGLFVEEPVTGPPPFLLYDPVVGKDIIGNNITEVITGTGITVNASRLLNGYGVKEFAAAGNGQVKVNFTQPLNFDNGDWTIEYDSIVDIFPPINNYTNDIYMYGSVANQYLFTIYGNTGEGLQAEFFKGNYVNNDYTKTWRYGGNRADNAGKVMRTAIVKKGSVINIYRNGTRVTAQNNLSNRPPITTTENIPNVTTGTMAYMLLGYINTSFPSYKGAFGRFAIYDYPRYTKSSYTVEPITVVSTVPGPSELISGDKDLGFYGEVSAADLIKYDALSTAVSLAAGQSPMIDGVWLKVAYKGKTLFIPKTPVRFNLSWADIHTAGVAKASQNKQIDIGSNRYLVRQMQGSNVDPYPVTTGDPNGGQYSTDTEWNKIMYGLMGDVLQPGEMEGIKLANYTTNNLGFAPLSAGSCPWVMEEAVGDGAVLRTDGSGNIKYISKADKTFVDIYRSWRPVLELVE